MKLKIISLLLIVLSVSSCSSGKSSYIYNSHNNENSSSIYSSSNDVDGKTYLPSAYYDSYYPDDFSWTNSSDLRIKLLKIIRTGYTAIEYAQWDICKASSQSLTNFKNVNQIYSQDDIKKTSTYSSTGNVKGWQKEHAFPASLMTGLTTTQAVKTKGMATDLHNLFASYGSANSSRGNCNYGNADKTYFKTIDNSDVKYTNVNPNTGGNADLDYNFEPGDEDKGMLARAIFYMALMYGEEAKEYEDDESQYGLSLQEDYVKFITGGEAPKSHGNLSTLLAWNEFKVNRLEYQHNETVYSAIYKDVSQGNRNPFVDYPDLVSYVYGENKDKAGKLSDLKPSKADIILEAKSIYNYAYSETNIDSYHVGDEFKFSTLTLNLIKQDFTFEEIKGIDSSFTVIGISDNYLFTSSDVGDKTISISTPINIIYFTISIASDVIHGATYASRLISNESQASEDENYILTSTSLENATTLKDSLNKQEWLFNFGITKTAVAKSGNGVVFGGASTTKPAVNNLSIESVNNISNIDYIAISTHTASNKSADLVIYIDEVSVYSTTVTYEKGEYIIYSTPTDINKSGKIKFEFNNVDAGLHIEYIAFNVIN